MTVGGTRGEWELKGKHIESVSKDFTSEKGLTIRNV
jgi:hypothetical protein